MTDGKGWGLSTPPRQVGSLSPSTELDWQDLNVSHMIGYYLLYLFIYMYDVQTMAIKVEVNVVMTENIIMEGRWRGREVEVTSLNSQGYYISPVTR